MIRTIYLHGFASGPTSSKARYFAQRLASAGMEVIVPALDSGNFEALTITGQLAVIEEAAAGQPVALIGSSLGGYLAALYAARHPEVSRVVLLAPAFRFPHRWAERLGPQVLEQWRAEGSTEVFHYGAGRSMRLGYQLIADAAQYEDFPAVTQPCLIFHGDHDEIVPVQLSQEFASGRPNVQLEVVDSGHDLLNVLDDMGDRVTRFLPGPSR